MWDEKRLIWFAGPGGGPPEGPGSNPPDAREDDLDDLRKGTRGQLKSHEGGVASDVMKTPDSSEDIEKRFEDLRAGFSTLEKLGLKERAEVIINLRRKIIEMRFLINYLRSTEFVEVVEGREIYRESEKLEVDLTAAAKELKEIEDELLKIKAEDKQKEVYLYRDLEKTRDTIRPKDFLKLPLADRLRLVSNIKSWDDLKDEALVVFNFGKNRALEYQIGLGDLMPPEIRKIALGGSVFARMANQGFYSNGRYLAIFSGSKVKIEQRDKDFAAKNEADYVKKFGDKYPQNEVLSVARDFGVDAYFLEAVTAVITGDEENGITEREEFLHIAARYIQNAEARFENEKESSIEAGYYKAEFLAYALKRFNLFNDFVYGRDESVKGVVEKYSSLRGVRIDIKIEDDDEPEVGSDHVHDNDHDHDHENSLKVPESAAGPERIVHGSRIIEHGVDEEALNIWQGFSAREDFLSFRENYSGRKLRLRETAYKCYQYARRLARSDGFDIKITSAHRGVDQQGVLYARSTQPGRLVAVPGTSWHHSGGTIDSTLVDASGRDLCRTGTKSQMDKYKRILERCLNRAGFVRYSVEWWHFEFGSDGWYNIMKKKGMLSTALSKKELVYSRRTA